MEHFTIERIRAATFGDSRRGYDRREVDSFLADLADWLESGGSDQVRSETVKRELERVGEKTAKILSTAEDAAEKMRVEADQEARETIEAAQAKARRIIQEGEQRRSDIEAVIADLVRRRDGVLAEMDRLTGQLQSAISEHRPRKGADPFEKPEQLDPLERESKKAPAQQRPARPAPEEAPTRVQA